ncbi:MAG: hypothetical protein WCI18_09230 [Pseudomonadota bacterium]
MADVQWIKNLAGSTFTDQGWNFPENFTPNTGPSERTAAAIDALYQETKEAIFCYNNFVSQNRQISILKIDGNLPERLSGLILMIGSLQLKIVRRSEGLEFILISVKSFGTHQKVIEKIFPCYDTFGSLFWQTGDQRATLTTEHIVKTALKELIKFVDTTKG